MSVSVTCPVYTLAAVSSADVAAAASWDPTPAQMAQVAFARRRRGRRVAGWGAFVLFVVGAACLLFPPGLIVVIPVALGLFAWAGVLYATPGKVSRATNAEAAFRDFFSGFSSVYTRGVSAGLMWDEADLAFVLLTPAARDEAAEVDRLRETWRAFWTSIAVEGSEATADVKEIKVSAEGDRAPGTALVVITSYSEQGNVKTHYAPVCLLFEARAVRHGEHWYMAGYRPERAPRLATVTYDD